jgi:hypothetical protein
MEAFEAGTGSLSRAIQQLEGELGGQLFHREHKFTHVTELGEIVRPHLATPGQPRYRDRAVSSACNWYLRFTRCTLSSNRGQLIGMVDERRFRSALA